MLIGREIECARLSAAISAARDGTGGAFVLTGEPGIGKTTLLHWIRRQAAGMVVLETRGFESAGELPYACLGDLLTPIVQRLDALPEPQAAVLASALGLAPRNAVDRHAVGVAALALLGAVAEDGAILLVVDDLQWVDSASRDALAFATRRLSSVPLVVAAAQRTSLTGAEPAIPGAEIVPVGPLAPDDAARVLAEQAEIAPGVAASLLEAARGNPLALVELPRLLTEDQLSGREPLVDPIPTINGLERAFAARLAPLSDGGRLAVLLMATDGSTMPGVVLAALERLGVDDSALAEVEELGLVSMGESGVEFRHPLVRSAAYHGTGAAQRRAAHAALAEVDPDLDRRVWHLASATLAPDEQLAVQLDAAGERALERGAFGSGAAAFERAAAFSKEGGARGRRLERAAAAREETGDLSRTEELVRQALGLVDDPLAHARLVARAASVSMATGRMESAAAALLAEAERIADLDPAAAGAMLAKASNLHYYRFEATKLAALTERAWALGGPDRPRAAGEAVMLANGKVLTGDVDGRAQLLDIAERATDIAGAHQLSSAVGWALIWVEEYDAARAMLAWASDVQRARGALKFLPWSLHALAEVDFRTGRWLPALSGIREAIDLLEETKQSSDLASACATAARLEAALGHDDVCRTLAEEAIARDAAAGLSMGLAEARAALGLLELGRGNHEAARTELDHVERIMRTGEVAEPWVLHWAPDLVEAYLRDGLLDRARDVLERFQSDARAIGRVSALAAAARCRGLLAADDAFDEPFAASLSLHDQMPTPFERARTELALGERLRRAGRRKEARERLRSALQTFDRLGAEPWAERARAELRASGQSVRTLEQRAVDALTPQELHVATLVADGATNREAAAALFLSGKTIEFHLGNVYRKLGIRSRTELARVVGAPG